MDVLVRSGGRPTLIYLNYLFPLAILKQILTMFFAISHPAFAAANEEIVTLVLNREAMYLSHRYRVFAYYNITGLMRQTPLSVKLDTAAMQSYFMTEISYPPFGYLMTIDSPPPDRRLIEISHFARYAYNEFAVAEVRMPLLPTHLLYPGDYRTRQEIIDGRVRGVESPLGA